MRRLSVWRAIFPPLHRLAPSRPTARQNFDSRAKGKQVLRLVSRIQNLGFAVQITPIAAPA
jgi:hypothetical protein